MTHLDTNGLTVTASKDLHQLLARILRKSQQVIDGGKPFDVVSLEFTKAFDKVPKKEIVRKIIAHGIRGRTLRRVRQWLT
jgi:hypothetical protein